MIEFVSKDTTEVSFQYVSSRRVTERQIIEFLKENGFARQELILTQQKKRSQICIYVNRAFRVKKILAAFKKTKHLEVQILIRRLAYADWAEKWKEDYQIQPLGRRFVVVPTWRREEYSSKKIRGQPVWIDPLSAFGSGEHETTQLMTRMIEVLRGRFDSFLDIGTGTGILSIVAAHCGAKKIVGFDRDKPSVGCAQMNFEANQVSPRSVRFVCSELARLRGAEKFDLVAANVNSNILEKHRHQILAAARPGGWVLVSGILRQTYASFRAVFDGKNLEQVKVLRGRQWVAVLFRKT